MNNHLFEASVYEKRRNELKSHLKNGKYLFLGNNESSINFKDNWYPFRQDSTFLYYFGLNLPGLAAIIDLDKDESIILGNESSLEDVIWMGPQSSLNEQAEMVGIHLVKPLSELNKICHPDIHYLPPYRPEHILLLSDLLNLSPAIVLQTKHENFIQRVVDQRSLKTDLEIKELDNAVSLSVDMHLAVMQFARKGMMEFELIGEAYKNALSNQGRMSFAPIMTVNGQVLHNHYYGNKLQENQMLLFDGGVENQKSYAGDLTRTFPVGKKFTTLQKVMYDVVYNAYERAVAMSKPGVLFKDVHLEAGKALIEGMIQIGIMKGDPEEAVAAGAHSLFFQCGLGHMMGLDVHDMENLGEEYVGYTENFKQSNEFGLKSLRLGKELKTGFVITIEPGVYMIPELFDIRKAEGAYKDFVNYSILEKFRSFGGIRLENDFVITTNGNKLLGKPLASRSNEIEAIRQMALES